MNSMTGFGKAEVSTKTGIFSVEMSSVNNRFLEIQIRQPKQFAPLETTLRELIGSKLSRGKVSVYVNFFEPEGSVRRYPLNTEAARTYHRQLTKLQKELKLAGEVTVSDIIAFPEVMSPPNGEYSEKALWAGLKKSATQALKELSAMRRREGEAIKKDLLARLNELERLNKRISKSAGGVVDRYRQKLHRRMDDLLAGRSVDPVRLEEEVALAAEKADISEECTRLSSHIQQSRKVARSAGPVGKQLNFLLQEFNREANTIASKCTELEISRDALKIKEEVEKLREQIQNIE
jgi:uncharacterized protein (TIGR00255 family)